MKDKHLVIRIEQCVMSAKASSCRQGRNGALLLDPKRNVVLMDGYNGPPKGAGSCCAGPWCHREGLNKEDVQTFSSGEDQHWLVYQPPGQVQVFPESVLAGPFLSKEDATNSKDKLLEHNQPIPSSEQLHIGCHHAEANVITTAAATGTPCSGAWLFVTGAPCLSCAKLIHHAEIERVIIISVQSRAQSEDGWFNDNFGTTEGIDYLVQHDVEVRHVVHRQTGQVSGS